MLLGNKYPVFIVLFFPIISLFRCSSNHVVQINKSNQINFNDLYYIDPNFITCKRIDSSTEKNIKPDYIIQTKKDCLFQKINHSEIFVLDCSKNKNRETFLYVKGIGNCYETISVYKRDFTKELHR